MKGWSKEFDFPRHQGLCFEDESGAVECHFNPGGLEVCGKEKHKCDKYLRRQRIRQGMNKSAGSCENWCRGWARGKEYSVIGYDCWAMVRAFCEAHKIGCPKTENSNAIRDVTGISGTVRGLTDGCKAFERGNFLEGTGHVATAPLRGVCEGVDCTVKNVDRAWCRLKKKWKL